LFHESLVSNIEFSNFFELYDKKWENTIFLRIGSPFLFEVYSGQGPKSIHHKNGWPYYFVLLFNKAWGNEFKTRFGHKIPLALRQNFIILNLLINNGINKTKRLDI